MSYDAAANAANEAQKRIAELEAQIKGQQSMIQSLERRVQDEKDTCNSYELRYRRERDAALRELATLRAQAERDRILISDMWEAINSRKLALLEMHNNDWITVNEEVELGELVQIEQRMQDAIAAVRARRGAGEGE